MDAADSRECDVDRQHTVDAPDLGIGGLAEDAPTAAAGAHRHHDSQAARKVIASPATKTSSTAPIRILKVAAMKAVRRANGP